MVKKWGIAQGEEKCSGEGGGEGERRGGRGLACR
jgi:hypothetical protein